MAQPPWAEPVYRRPRPTPTTRFEPEGEGWWEETFGPRTEYRFTEEERELMRQLAASDKLSDYMRLQGMLQTGTHTDQPSWYEQDVLREYVDPYLGLPQIPMWAGAMMGGPSAPFFAAGGLALGAGSLAAGAPQALYDVKEAWEDSEGVSDFAKDVIFGGEDEWIGRPAATALEGLGAWGDLGVLRRGPTSVGGGTAEEVAARATAEADNTPWVKQWNEYEERINQQLLEDFKRKNPRYSHVVMDDTQLPGGHQSALEQAVNIEGIDAVKERVRQSTKAARDEASDINQVIETILEPEVEDVASAADAQAILKNIETPAAKVEPPLSPNALPTSRDVRTADIMESEEEMARIIAAEQAQARQVGKVDPTTNVEPQTYSQAKDLFDDMRAQGVPDVDIETKWAKTTATAEERRWWNRYKKENQIQIADTEIPGIQHIDPTEPGSMDEVAKILIPDGATKIAKLPETPPTKVETPDEIYVRPEKDADAVYQAEQAAKPLPQQIKEGSEKLVRSGFTAQESLAFVKDLAAKNVPIAKGVDEIIEAARVRGQTVSQEVYDQSVSRGLDPKYEHVNEPGHTAMAPDVADARVTEYIEEFKKMGYSDQEALEHGTKKFQLESKWEFPELKRDSVRQMEFDLGTTIPEPLRTQYLDEEAAIMARRVRVDQIFADSIKEPHKFTAGVDDYAKTGTKGTVKKQQAPTGDEVAARVEATQAQETLRLTPDQLQGEQGMRWRQVYNNTPNASPQVWSRAANGDLDALLDVQKVLFPGGRGLPELGSSAKLAEDASRASRAVVDDIIENTPPEKLLMTSRLTYESIKHLVAAATKPTEEWAKTIITRYAPANHPRVKGGKAPAHWEEGKKIWDASIKDYDNWMNKLFKSNYDLYHEVQANKALQTRLLATTVQHHAVQKEVNLLLNSLGLNFKQTNTQWMKWQRKHKDLLPEEFVAQQIGTEFVDDVGKANLLRGLEVFGDRVAAGSAITNMRRLIAGGHHNLDALAAASQSGKSFEAQLKAYNKAVTQLEEIVTQINSGLDPTMLQKILPGGAKAVSMLGGGFIGATAGSALYQDQGAEDEALGKTGLENRQFWAMLAGLGAGMAGPGVLKTLKTKPGMEAIFDATYFNILQKPATMSQAMNGALGGATIGAIEQMLSGFAKLPYNPKLGLEQMLKGGKTLANFFDLSPEGGAATWMKAITNPEWARSVVLEGAPGRVHHRPGILGMPGRVFTAFDAVAVNAMKKGGYTAQDAARFTLAGDPATLPGRQALKLLSGQVKQLDAINPLLRLGFLFPRVGILAVEGAMQRMPVLGMMDRFAAGADMPRRLARQATGAGAGYVGHEYLADPEMDASTAAFLAPLAGPAIIPLMAGFAARRAKQRGGAPGTSMWEEATQMSPLGAQPLRFFTDPGAEVQRRLVPGLIGDTARGLDPEYGRETGAQALIDAGEQWGLAEEGLGSYVPLGPAALGPLRSMLPGVREGLPVKDVPVDSFGNPRLERLPREQPDRFLEQLLFPRREWLAPPPQNVMDDPTLKQYHEDFPQLRFPPPSGTEQVQGVPGSDLPVGADRRAYTQRVKGADRERALSTLLSIPMYQTVRDHPDMSPVQKEGVIRQIIGQLMQTDPETGLLLMENPELIREALGL